MKKEIRRKIKIWIIALVVTSAILSIEVYIGYIIVERFNWGLSLLQILGVAMITHFIAGFIQLEKSIKKKKDS